MEGRLASVKLHQHVPKFNMKSILKAKIPITETAPSSLFQLFTYVDSKWMKLNNEYISLSFITFLGRIFSGQN